MADASANREHRSAAVKCASARSMDSSGLPPLFCPRKCVMLDNVECCPLPVLAGIGAEMSMAHTAIVLAEGDNVGVVTADVRPGADVRSDDRTVSVRDPIPFGHKIALSPIARPVADVIKFGVPIGRAKAPDRTRQACPCPQYREHLHQQCNRPLRGVMPLRGTVPLRSAGPLRGAVPLRCERSMPVLAGN